MTEPLSVNERGSDMFCGRKVGRSSIICLGLLVTLFLPGAVTAQVDCGNDVQPPEITVGVPVATFALQDGWVHNHNSVAQVCGMTWTDNCGSGFIHGINELQSLSGEVIGGVQGAWMSEGISADWMSFRLNLDRNLIGPREYLIRYAVIDAAWNWAFAECRIRVVDEAPDLCDGIDNDDDGVIDEDFDPAVVMCGVGACRAEGQTACVDGAIVEQCTPAAGSAELCGNGVDDDCNGAIDDGFDVGAPCSAGVGACGVFGTRVCTADGTGTECDAAPAAPRDERCGNGIDDDCDGETDEPACEDAPVDCSNDSTPPVLTLTQPEPVFELRDAPGWQHMNVAAMCGLIWHDDCTDGAHVLHGINLLSSPSGEAIFGQPGAYWSDGISAEWHSIDLNLNRAEVGPRTYLIRYAVIDHAWNWAFAECTVNVVDEVVVEPPPAESVQPPVMVTFDFHMDPMSQGLSVDARRGQFVDRMDNADWLLDTVDPHGAPISFLSTGEFLEFCREDGEARCFPLLRRLQASGGVVATHIHDEIREGAHDWPSLGALRGGSGNITEADIERNWDDTKSVVDAIVRDVFGVDTPEEIAAINAAAMGHLPDSHTRMADLHAIMEARGYTIREGGGEQAWVPYFGHIPYTVFRPGDCGTCEDLDTNLVTVPQSQVIGKYGEHFGVVQDGRAPRKQVELLGAIVNRRIDELAGKPERLWTYGWGLHGHDISPGSESRNSIEIVIPWIAEVLAPHGLAEFASYIDVRDRYEDWEARHPGTSSFDYREPTIDYAQYPYSEWANHYLRYAHYDRQMHDPIVHAFALTVDARQDETDPDPRSLVLAYAIDVDHIGTVDLSGVFGAIAVRSVRLADGVITDVSADAVEIGADPMVLCVAADCEAVLALEDWIDDPGCGEGLPCGPGLVCHPDRSACVVDCRRSEPACPRADLVCDVDSGMCLPDQGGGGGCAGGCPNGQVCAEVVDQCVPDCRLPQNTCPPIRPVCDQGTGVCDVDIGDVCGGCPQSQICVPEIQRCVNDCRLPGEMCPPSHPTCVEETGICRP